MDTDARELLVQTLGTAAPVLLGTALGVLLFFVGCFT